MAKIEIKGLDKLEKSLKKNVQMSDVKKVVRHHGAQLQQQMQANADFKKGYQTGTTKRSIGLEMQDGGFTASVGPETEYAPCLQIGRSVWQHTLKNRTKSVEILNTLTAA